MANTYTWTVTQLYCYPEAEGQTDVVFVADFNIMGTDANNHIGSVYGTASFSVDPTKPDYTHFDQLTEEEVITWSQNSLGANQVSSLYSNIDTQIENQINPPIVNPPLPWNH